jgi:hypothetical protein
MTSLNALIARIITSVAREPGDLEEALAVDNELLIGVEYEDLGYAGEEFIDFIINFKKLNCDFEIKLTKSYLLHFHKQLKNQFFYQYTFSNRE